jgi:hypothetical protein
MKISRSLPRSLRSLQWTIVALFALGAEGCASTANETRPAPPDEDEQAGFASADEAVQSLVSALRAHDRERLKQILGPNSDDVISSGDPIADREAGERFVAAYDTKHQLIPASDRSVTLSTGDTDWPLPIPVVQDQKDGQWFFDTTAGKDEILSRRIGRNELDVIQVCHAIVGAQRDYAVRDPNRDGIPTYARQFLSDPGTKNGLYWPTNSGQAPSPLGPLIGEAVAEGYASTRATTTGHQPYHGYYYAMLTAQGAHAPGGQFSYIVHDRLIGGFATIAWPADYGNSGIMTFVVNQQGIVYQQDLGTDTARLAATITEFDPGPGWKVAE